jgi:tripartite-type tricarboxylate transporter receptor subunit TctC
MKFDLSRLRLFSAALGVAALTSTVALSQSSYPNKPIRILVGFAPGGPSDIISRVVGAKMGDIMGAQFVVENKTGAGGAIATQDVARSAPDGYTLLNTPVATVANEFLSKTIKYEYGKDIIAVCPQAETANILVVSPALGVKTVADLVKLAKEKPGVLQYATAGRGSATHLTSELFNMAASIKTTAVHYRGGGDTIKDLLSGEVKMMFSSIAPVQDFVRDGRLVGLATTGPKRDPAFPDLPTIAESGYPGFDVRLWIGMTAPAATPKDIIHKLADANRRRWPPRALRRCLDRRRISTPSIAPSATNGARSSRKLGWTRTRRGRPACLGKEPSLPLGQRTGFGVRFVTNDQSEDAHYGLDHTHSRRDLRRPRDQRLPAGRILISFPLLA